MPKRPAAHSPSRHWLPVRRAALRKRTSVCRSVTEERPAFNAIDLTISRGCITALIGPSGCGKTTLLSALNRLTDLIPGSKIEGRVTLEWEDIRAPRINV